MCSVFLRVTISGLAAGRLVQYIGKFFYNIPSAEMMSCFSVDSAVSGSRNSFKKKAGRA